MPLLTGSKPVSPPTLDRVGRHGQLALAFERQQGRTVLTHRRFTLPLQVLEPLSLGEDPSTCLTLLNPTGGILGGDHLTSEISLGSGTHVCLTTPSATKVYRTSEAPAVQELTFRLGQDAVLEYVPDHVIPHPGAIFHQSVTIEMARGSCAILFDAFAIGRLARGEHWMFTKLVNRITVNIEGRPVFVDRLCCEPRRQAGLPVGRGEPATRALEGPGIMDGFGYLATLVLVADRPRARHSTPALMAGVSADRDEPWSHIADALRMRLRDVPSVAGGVSILAQRGCVTRFLAPSAPALTHTFHLLWSACRDLLLHLPPLNLRKY